MVIHFSILALMTLVSIIWEPGTRKIKFKYGSKYKMPLLPLLIIFGYIAFLAAMRTSMNDTSAYVGSFKAIKPSFENIQNIILGEGKDKGFNILANLFKLFISSDYHMWFGFFSVVESLCFIYIIRKESMSIWETCFFFFASTLYYNYFSMMRQWLAVSLFFLAFKWMKNKQFIPYLLTIIFAAQFHNSAYMCIPIYFLVQDEPWCKKQLIYIFLICVGIIYLNPILTALLGGDDNTYNYVIDTMKSNSGSSPIRILIASVPVGLSLLYKDNILKENNHTLNVLVNISLIHFFLNVIATFTSGLYIIRMSVYFNTFNMLLFPYLIERIVDHKYKLPIKYSFFIFYFAFYYYQMTVQGAFGYNSDILGRF